MTINLSVQFVSVYAHMCVLERDASLSVFVSNVLYICVSMSEDV